MVMNVASANSSFHVDSFRFTDTPLLFAVANIFPNVAIISSSGTDFKTLCAYPRDRGAMIVRECSRRLASHRARATCEQSWSCSTRGLDKKSAGRFELKPMSMRKYSLSSYIKYRHTWLNCSLQESIVTAIPKRSKMHINRELLIHLCTLCFTLYWGW